MNYKKFLISNILIYILLILKKNEVSYIFIYASLNIKLDIM